MNLPIANDAAGIPNAESAETSAGPVAATPARIHLLDWNADDLKTWLTQHGHKPFRAGQILSAIYQRGIRDFDAISDLPKKLRQQLAETFDIYRGGESATVCSSDGTDKLLVQLADGGEVECVLLRDGNRRSICVSSQVGCAMGCVFCASGLDGVDRNLTRGEILEQMLRLQSRLADGERLSHIVMMGMGEPLANLNNVLSALDVAKSDEGLGISARRITISTVGLPPAIDRLAAAGVPYNLAVSLHAPNEELRNELVPVNRKIGIEAVLAAADRYFEACGRRLTFEYVLLGDVNDSDECARQLVRRLKNRTSMLNVIPYNPVEGLPYETPKKTRTAAFRKILEAGGVNVQFRHRKGSEIDAACGQLRRHRDKLKSSPSAPTHPV